MKTTNILVSIGIIIIVVIVGMMLSRSTGEPEPLPTMGFVPPEGRTVGTGEESNEDLPAGQIDLNQQSPAATATATPSTTSGSQQQSAGTVEVVMVEEMTVSITDTGFEPSKVTIPVGTTVVFVNNGQALHWPASGVHPTHEILPGFDAKRGLATGDTYSFTFEQKGSWPMHDHLNPRTTGTIVVE